MYPTETEVVDPVSDLDVLTAGCYEDPSVADALREMYECEAAITDADLEAMHAASQADGVEIDFGPFDRAAWEAEMAKFPEGCGLVPVIAPRRGVDGAEEWEAELRRPTPAGPDVVKCLSWPTQAAAWAACVSRARTMVVLAENGRKDVAERFFDVRAGREIAPRGVLGRPWTWGRGRGMSGAFLLLRGRREGAGWRFGANL